MTRRGILLAYKILGPFGLFLAFLGLLDTIGLISVSERGLGEFYTLFAVVTYAIGFALIPLAVLCPIIAVRYRRDLPVMLPSLLMFFAILSLLGPAFAGYDEVPDLPVGILALAAVFTATWAGWFTKAPATG